METGLFGAQNLRYGTDQCVDQREVCRERRRGLPLAGHREAA
jgi:hypothetical protein